VRIALLCATRRGFRFLTRLSELAPDADLLVFSFPEEAGEPRFLDDIRDFARARGAEFVEARKVGADRHRAIWNRAPVDLLFAVSWRYMIPSAVYGHTRLGSYVFHDSLLPAYRGFAPTVWAMVNGESQTGVTLFEMAEAVDSGPIVDQRAVPIGTDDTIADVLDRVTDTYNALLEANIAQLLDGTAPRRAQDESLATFTCKRIADDARIDWTQSARRVHDLIRASTRPYAGAFTMVAGKRLRIWEAQQLLPAPTYVGRIPGRVVQIVPGSGTIVLAGDGAVLVRRVQLDDGAEIDATQVLDSLGQTLGR
jgi:methionyl-tRNA formyltransferase